MFTQKLTSENIKYPEFMEPAGIGDQVQTTTTAKAPSCSSSVFSSHHTHPEVKRRRIMTVDENSSVANGTETERLDQIGDPHILYSETLRIRPAFPDLALQYQQKVIKILQATIRKENAGALDRLLLAECACQVGLAYDRGLAEFSEDDTDVQAYYQIACEEDYGLGYYNLGLLYQRMERHLDAGAAFANAATAKTKPVHMAWYYRGVSLTLMAKTQENADFTEAIKSFMTVLKAPGHAIKSSEFIKWIAGLSCESLDAITADDHDRQLLLSALVQLGYFAAAALSKPGLKDYQFSRFIYQKAADLGLNEGMIRKVESYLEEKTDSSLIKGYLYSTAIKQKNPILKDSDQKLFAAVNERLRKAIACHPKKILTKIKELLEKPDLEISELNAYRRLINDCYTSSCHSLNHEMTEVKYRLADKACFLEEYDFAYNLYKTVQDSGLYNVQLEIVKIHLKLGKKYQHHYHYHLAHQQLCSFLQINGRRMIESMGDSMAPEISDSRLRERFIEGYRALETIYQEGLGVPVNACVAAIAGMKATQIFLYE